VMDVSAGRKISPKAGELPQNGRQRVRYMTDDSSSDVFTVQSFEVRKGPQLLYHVSFDDLPSKGVELKVMVWWEELP